MYAYTILSAIIATAVAAPFPFAQRAAPITGASKTWKPSDRIELNCAAKPLSGVSNAQRSSAIDGACAALMPACAYPDRAPKGTKCNTNLFLLEGPESSTQKINSGKNGINVKFDIDTIVMPYVQWTIQDCYGYFNVVLDDCHGTGSVNVLGNRTQAAVEYKISIV